MGTSIKGSQPRSISSAKTEAAKPAARAATAAKTDAAAAKEGWGAKGAGKTGKVTTPQTGTGGALKVLSAKVSDDIGGATTGFPAPKGFSVSTAEDNRKEAVDLPNGKQATFEWTSSTLTAKGPDGKDIVLAGKDDAGFQQYSSDFHDNFKGITKEDLEFQPEPMWDAQRSYSGYGSAGKLMSVNETVSDYTGGAHPNSGTQLRTFDLATGKPVTLDQLLSKEQFQGLCNTIASTLPKLKGPDGIDGQSFQPYQDMSKMVAENFAISTGKDGKPVITVAWESGIHALGGVMASFQFAAPDDAAFRAKAGIE